MTRRPRTAGEAGFTLVELLLAMSIGLVILGATTQVTIGALRNNEEVANRVVATQTGRLALERIQRSLRSQVCVQSSMYPVAGAEANRITFFSDLKDGAPQRHVVTYDAASRSLTDAVTDVDAGPNETFTGTARTTTLATQVDAPASGQVFRFYAYPDTVAGGAKVEPNVALTAPVTGTDIGEISRIDVNFLVTGATRRTGQIKAEMSNQVFVRLARPNDTTTPNPNYNPTCT